MKRGRPKARSCDSRSFGPLGDLIRKNRILLGLGLAEVAKACECSVQFISNIEHGRAPLPWEKVSQLALVLKISFEDIQAANLSVRSDFRSFVGGTKGGAAKGSKTRVPTGKTRKPTAFNGTASAVATAALAAKDSHLCEILKRYQSASIDVRKKFVRSAMQIFDS
ncbi:helix-turn-helix transcriptional regulator [Bdellovibrionota bacterium FG-2]